MSGSSSQESGDKSLSSTLLEEGLALYREGNYNEAYRKFQKAGDIGSERQRVIGAIYSNLAIAQEQIQSANEDEIPHMEGAVDEAISDQIYRRDYFLSAKIITKEDSRQIDTLVIELFRKFHPGINLN